MTTEVPPPPAAIETIKNELPNVGRQPVNGPRLTGKQWSAIITAIAAALSGGFFGHDIVLPNDSAPPIAFETTEPTTAPFYHYKAALELYFLEVRMYRELQLRDDIDEQKVESQMKRVQRAVKLLENVERQTFTQQRTEQ